MPSLHLKMQLKRKELLQAIPSFAMLSSAMQSQFPSSKPSAGNLRSPRGNDAASLCHISYPLSCLSPAELDGKMQLPPGLFPPYLTPSGEARTQTHNGKAWSAKADSLDATTTAEVSAGNGLHVAKCKCLIGGVFFATDVATATARGSKATASHSSAFTQKRTQAARDGRRLPKCDSQCASSDVANTFPDGSLSTPLVSPARCIAGEDRQVEHVSLAVRFTQLDNHASETNSSDSDMSVKCDVHERLGHTGCVWGSNGFDMVRDEINASRGCLVGLVKLSRQNITENTNPVNSSVAMSVAQADAVLAKYGYSDAVVVTA